MKRLLILLTASAFGAAPLLDAPLATAETAPETSTCSPISVAIDHIISTGHQDLRIGTSGSIVVRDGADDHKSGTVAFAVPDKARTSFNIPGFADNGFFLDQTQDYTMPWFGFSTEDTSESVRVSIDSVRVPVDSVTEPGRIVAWHTQISGEVDFLLDSADPDTTYSLPAGSHDHVNWAFSEPGAYDVTFLVDTGSSRETYDVVFLVGDEAIAGAESGSIDFECEELAPPAPREEPQPVHREPRTRPAPVEPGKVNPRQLETDIKQLTKEFTALDKAWGTFTKQMETDLAPQSATPKQRTQSADKSGAAKKDSEKSPAKAKPAKTEAEKSNTNQSNTARSNNAQSGAASQKKASGSQRGSRAASGTKESSDSGAAAKRDSTRTRPDARSDKPTKEAKATKRRGSGSQASDGDIPDAPAASAGGSNGPNDGAGNSAMQGDEATLAQQSWQKSGWWPGAVAGAGVTALLAGLLLLVAAQRITSGGAV
ncbi:choice-of-anchor M domain-containing protein [Corynebacterium sp.]|uniref:choice-of-anchor M domain-containing protein n=1 Tax=Corynebacterium sp. TaxID=1720 RepID=UPI002A91FFF3|nr:choice-of-anchor M domain-containing protein [Corynebacterium sp.]MDY5786232.1 choice-of-anchor M domain-containing protein [Corynebacterium sp.]